MPWLLCVVACSRPDPRPPGQDDGRTAALVAMVRAEGEREHGVARLAEYSAHGDVAVRSRALLGLGRVGSADAAKVLSQALGDPSAVIRREAARALGISGTDSAEPALLACWQRETDGDVRAAVVEALGRVAMDAQSMTVLAAALADARLAEHAALAMARFGRRQRALDNGARDALVRAARDRRPEVRRAVALALAREHEPQPIPAVIEALAALSGDADTETRAHAIRGLKVHGQGVPDLGGALAHDDWRVRVAAVRTAARPGALAAELDAVARALGREWSALAREGWRSPRVHVISEGLRALLSWPKDSPPELRDIADTLARAAAARLGDPDHTIALAASTVHCLAAALAARAETTAQPGLHRLRGCGGPADRGLPAHERAALLAEALARGIGGTAEERTRELLALAAAPDPRVAAAAVAVLPRLAGDAEPAARARILAVLGQVLAHPAVELAGAAAEAVAALAAPGADKTPPSPAQAELTAAVADLARGPLLQRARAEADNIELALTLMTALTTARVAEAVPLCEAALGHDNVTMRQTARACVKGITGRDPGPGRASWPPRLPPVDPAEVAGRPMTLVLTTTKGTIEIALDTEAAPWHVATIKHLADSGFYRGLIVHRVVPDFVVQGGDPRGSGWGGPPFVIPAEPSAGSFHRGAVGIADAGLDTGGSQWFITHSAAPFLDGRYTRIGHVVRGQEVVDTLLIGDRLEDARVEARSVASALGR